MVKKNYSTLQNRKTVIHFPWKLHWGFWSGTVLCKTGDETQNPGSLGGGVGWCFLKKEKAMGAFQCISNRMKDHLAFSTYSKTTPKLKNKSSKNKSSKNSIIYIRKHLANYCQKLNELLKGFFGKNPLKKVQNCKTCPRYLFHWLLYSIVLFYLHLLYSFLVFETHYKEREK